MSVPGDAGYEVERFAEKKCETCGKQGRCNEYLQAACLDAGHWLNWIPKQKLASPIGETVLTDNDFKEIFLRKYGYIPATQARDSVDLNRKFQDAHTRSIVIPETRRELIRQGWKSPEEIQELITKVSNASNREGHTDQERLMKECGWKSPEEIQKSFNPESLNYKKGVIDGRLFESREVAKELKKITVYPDSDTVFDDRVVIGREEYDAIIRRLEG
jgi:hypothetical protein